MYATVSDESLTVSDSGLAALNGIGIVLGTTMVISGGNLLRTPIEKKLDLDVSPIDKVHEYQYTVKKLEEYADSRVLSFEEVSERSYDVVRDFVFRVDGYSGNWSRKVKKSFFSSQLSLRGMGGLFNPFIHEVVITSTDRLEYIAHERAHQSGYLREREAQFIGYAAMIESGDPSFQYLAFRQRFDMLMNAMSEDDFIALGLNERTLNEFLAIRDQDEKALDRFSWYGLGKYKIGRAIRSIFLKSTGQGDISHAYFGKPLELISAYDPPILS